MHLKIGVFLLLLLQQAKIGARLTAGSGGEVLQRGPLHAEVALSHHKDFVQDGAVVDEALQHAGRVDISQAAGAEDQGHLQGRGTGQDKGGVDPQQSPERSDSPRGRESRAPLWSYKLGPVRKERK